jgi:hypothetical protein
MSKSIVERLKESGAPENVVDQLSGMTWDQVVELESGGERKATHLLFPAKLQQLKRGGGFESKSVLLRIPREPEMRQARVNARRRAMEAGLDPDRDKDLFESLETICILEDAICEPDGNYEPVYPFDGDLERCCDRQSLAAIYGLLENLSGLLDPNPETISEDEMMTLIGMIAKRRDIVPLAVYGSDAQRSFIVTMADRLLSCMDSKSSSDVSEP